MLLVLLASLGSATLASGASDSENDFAQGIALLEKGAFDDAVDRFEALSDRGFLHPDASYNRAVAYLQRSESSQGRSGDLGKAAAALEETLLLRPNDDAAAQLLERVRSEIARKRARAGGVPRGASPSLGRAVVGLMSENSWAVAALTGSGLLSLGLLLRLFFSGAGAHLGGVIAASVGAVLLTSCGALAAAARSERMHSQPAVVVVSEARMLNENATPLERARRGPEDEALIPEGARVLVLERKGQLARVEWGSEHSWVLKSQLRVLQRP